MLAWQAAVEGVEQVLGDAMLIGSVSGQPQAWVSALAALYSHLQSQQDGDAAAAAALASEWQALGSDVQADALRCDSGMLRHEPHTHEFQGHNEKTACAVLASGCSAECWACQSSELDDVWNRLVLQQSVSAVYAL